MQSPQDEKIQSYFDQIAIWELEGEHKTEIAQSIIEDVHTGIEYWSQMLLSAIIATLGLYINATPVVIGAMLIAPILRPIQAVAFATTTGNRRLFFKGLWLLIISILVGVCAAILITWVLPFTQLTNEILMRTQPTIIDLGIAFASGLIAFLAFGFRKIAAGLAGVAMAASLVPPLGVIGIGIGLMNWQVAVGSTILFLTNLVAIIIGGVIIFFLFGYSPNQKKERKTSMVSAISAVIFMIALAVPLVSSFTSIITNEQDKTTIKSVVEGYLGTHFSHVALESFDFTMANTQSDSATNGRPLSLILRAPTGVDITQQHQDELTSQIATSLNKDIALTMTIIPFTSVKVGDATPLTFSETVSDTVQNFLDILYPPVILLDIQVRQQSQTLIVAELYTSEQFDTSRFQTQLEDYLTEKSIAYDLLLLTRKQQQSQTDESQLTLQQLKRQENIDTLSANFRSSFPQDLLQKLALKRGVAGGYVVEIYLATADDKENITTRLTDRQESAQAILDDTVRLDTHIQYLETVTID